MSINTFLCFVARFINKAINLMFEKDINACGERQLKISEQLTRKAFFLSLQTL
jgi:hypothetical protein